MKREFFQAFGSALDVKNELIINEINERFEFGTVRSNQTTLYGNIAISSKKIYEDFMTIRNHCVTNIGLRPSFVHVFDLGAGIGNVLELMGVLIKSDSRLSSELKRINLRGIEKEAVYVDIAKKTLPMITPYVNLTLADFSLDITDGLKAFYKGMTKAYEDKQIAPTLNIVYLNRPFRELEEEARFEKHILSNVPAGTYVCFPMGCKVMPKKGFKVFSINLLKKTNINVSY